MLWSSGANAFANDLVDYQGDSMLEASLKDFVGDYVLYNVRTLLGCKLRDKEAFMKVFMNQEDDRTQCCVQWWDGIDMHLEFEAWHCCEWDSLMKWAISSKDN